MVLYLVVKVASFGLGSPVPLIDREHASSAKSFYVAAEPRRFHPRHTYHMETFAINTFRICFISTMLTIGQKPSPQTQLLLAMLQLSMLIRANSASAMLVRDARPRPFVLQTPKEIHIGKLLHLLYVCSLGHLFVIE